MVVSTVEGADMWESMIANGCSSTRVHAKQPTGPGSEARRHEI
jgi:hypothetical protein